MTGGPNRSLEELLSDRLHEVDAVEPPDRDFEFRALRAGRERLKRRQARTRGLVGAAAALVIGAVAIPSLGRLTTSGGESSSSSAASAVAGSAVSAPSKAAPELGSGDARDLASTGSPVDGASLDNVPDALRATFAHVRSELSAPAYDQVFTSLTFDPSVAPAGRVVVHLTWSYADAIAVVRSAFAGGPDVGVEISPYSLTSCTATWTTLAADAQVRSQAPTIAVLGCDANGRVAVRVAPGAAAATVDHLRSYGDAVYLFGG